MRAHIALLVTGILAATSASAQFYPAPGPGTHRAPPAVASTSVKNSTVPNIGLVYRDIDEGRRNGQLSHRQARELRREAGEISTLEQRYAADGMSDSEAAELQNRVEALKSITDSKRSGLIK
jgi:hypothetical protein